MSKGCSLSEGVQACLLGGDEKRARGYRTFGYVCDKASVGQRMFGTRTEFNDRQNQKTVVETMAKTLGYYVGPHCGS